MRDRRFLQRQRRLPEVRVGYDLHRRELHRHDADSCLDVQYEQRVRYACDVTVCAVRVRNGCVQDQLLDECGLRRSALRVHGHHVRYGHQCVDPGLDA